MNVEYTNGTREHYGNLTSEEAVTLATEKIGDPEVERIDIYRENTNRHQRRKDAALATAGLRHRRGHGLRRAGDGDGRGGSDPMTVEEIEAASDYTRDVEELQRQNQLYEAFVRAWDADQQVISNIDLIKAIIVTRAALDWLDG